MSVCARKKRVTERKRVRERDSVHSILYTVQCSLYVVQCRMYSVLYMGRDY